MSTRPTLASAQPLHIVAVLAAALTITGCEVNQAGENEILSFRFDAAESIIPARFDTAIAVGTRVDVLTSQAASTSTAVSVIEAESDADAVISVEGTAGNRIILSAKAPGTARISVRTVNGDDAFTVTSADIARIELKAPGLIVSDNPASLLVVGGRARFFVGLRDANDRHLVGHGPVPVGAEPRSAATILETDDVGFLDVRPGAAGTLTLKPLGGDDLTVEAVAVESVTGIELKGAAAANIKVGNWVLTTLRGITDDASRVAGLGDLASVATESSDICAITPMARMGDGVFEIKGLAEGTCRVNATLGAVAARYDFNIIP